MLYIRSNISVYQLPSIMLLKKVTYSVLRQIKHFTRAASTKPMASASGDSGNGRGNGVPKPFVIGVAGGTASGKSTVCSKIMEQLGQAQVDRRQRQVAIINQDSFYKVLTETEKELAAKGQFNFDHPGLIQQSLKETEQELAANGQFNFDHPDAFDNECMMETMQKVVQGKTVDIPAYDYVNNCRRSSNLAVYPADVVLLEGILVFYFKELRDMFHMKLFVDTDPDTRLSRRVLRDTKERGRDLDTILNQYTTLVKPAFEEFCLPTKKYADVIIPRGADNTVAIDLIVQHIQELLRPSKENISKRFRHNSDSFVGRPH